MKSGIAIIATACVAFATMSVAETYTAEQLVQIATDSGVCGEGVVLSAVLLETGDISAKCDEGTAFIPLIGPAALGFLGAVLAASAGGDGTGSTGSTSGSN